jgi:hypothetical protein
MVATDTAQPVSPRNAENLVDRQARDSCVQSVLSSYAKAMERLHKERGAFDAAVQSYLLYYPNVPEPAARAAVAGIIC